MHCGWRAQAAIQTCPAAQRGALRRQERQDSDRQALLTGASTSREDVDRSAAALSHVRQGRRGVEEMLDQATHVLAGIGATRETLKARARCSRTGFLSTCVKNAGSGC